MPGVSRLWPAGLEDGRGHPSQVFIPSGMRMPGKGSKIRHYLENNRTARAVTDPSHRHRRTDTGLCGWSACRRTPFADKPLFRHEAWGCLTVRQLRHLRRLLRCGREIHRMRTAHANNPVLSLPWPINHGHRLAHLPITESAFIIIHIAQRL